MKLPASFALLAIWCCLSEGVVIPSQDKTASLLKDNRGSRSKVEPIFAPSGDVVIPSKANRGATRGDHSKGTPISAPPELEPVVEPLAKELDDSLDKFGKPHTKKDKTPISTNPEHTWGHDRSRLSRSCEPGGPHEQCGDGGLVCNHGTCVFCKSDDECPSLHNCFLAMSGENVCVPEAEKAWEKVSTEPSHLLCSVGIFFSAMLASAAGIGGGTMFVPLFILFAVLKAESAVPLCQCMIFCSSFCNLMFFVVQRHTHYIEQPKIDYDCIVLFEPMLCLGVTFGILLHRISPQWFLLSLMTVTLGLAFWRTAAKGWRQRVEEQFLMGGWVSHPAPTILSPMKYGEELAEVTSGKSTQLVGIVFVWLLMFMASFHGLSPCSLHFGAFIAALAGLLVLCTVITIKYVLNGQLSDGTPRGPCPVDWTGKTVSKTSLGNFTFPMIAFCGGLLGGCLGIGGGIIMGPVLVEVGMHSESVQATTAMIVFLSSSLATMQFALLQQIVWHYALWYCSIAIVATLVGQLLCEVYVRRTGRYSIITLSIAAVLLFSLMALAFVGTHQVIADVKYGQQMWWSTAGLCSTESLPFFDIDTNPIVNPSSVILDPRTR